MSRLELLSNQLLSSELKDRISGIEQCTTLFQKPPASLNDEYKIKLYNSCLNILKESNSKIILLALECVQVFIVEHLRNFKNLMNMSFDILLVKLGDTKVAVRMLSLEVFVSFISIIGLSAGIDKLSGQLNHRNINIRENLLKILSRLYDSNYSEFKSLSNNQILLGKLIITLGDPQNSVRDAAIETIAKLNDLWGFNLNNDLETAGVKYVVIKSISDAIKKNKLSNIGSKDDLYMTAESTEQSPISALSRTTPLPPKRASSAGPTKRLSTSTLMPNAPINFKDEFNLQIKNIAVVNDLNSRFHPAAYMNLLQEGEIATSIKIYNEKELTKYTNQIVEGLQNQEDWTLRVKALLTLQGLVLGDGPEYEQFLVYIRSICDILCAQIVDLRSSISKEACRTVAFMARRYGSQFNIHAEILLPALMRQLPIKVAVMSSAADRSISIILASLYESGSVRILQFLMECFGNKSALIRKAALDYLCLVTSLWKHDTIFEKQLPALKVLLKSGLSDADGLARKSARYLFAVMRSRPVWQSTMDRYMTELDPSAQKLLAIELQQPSSDLLELYRRSQPPRDSIFLTDDSNVTESPVQLEAFEENNVRKSSVPSTVTVVAAKRAASRVNMRPVPPPASNTDAELFTKPISAPTTGSTAGGGVPSSGAKRLAMSGPVRVTAPSSGTQQMSSAFPQPDVFSQGTTAPPTSATTATSYRRGSMGMVPVNYPEPPAAYKATRVALPVNPASAELAATLPASSRVLGEGARRIARPPPKLPATSTAGFTSGGGAAVAENIRVLDETLDLAPTPSASANEHARQVMEAAFYTPQSSVVVDEKPKQQQQDSWSLDDIERRVNDDHWNERVLGLEAIYSQITTTSNQTTLTIFGELAINRLEDANAKVALQSIQVLNALIVNQPDILSSKLGGFLPIVFLLAGDKRHQIKEGALDLLTCIRGCYQPVVIATALCPRISEVSDRIKTAVIQFLIVTVPFCEKYFSQSSNTFAFLNRLSNILGAQGIKPSTALNTAGKRLLELVFKVAKQVVCVQIGQLSITQQVLLKGLLHSLAPDINALVAASMSLNNRKEPSVTRVPAAIVLIAEPVAQLPPESASGTPISRETAIITPPRPLLHSPPSLASLRNTHESEDIPIMKYTSPKSAGPTTPSHTNIYSTSPLGIISPPSSVVKTPQPGMENRDISWILDALGSSSPELLVEGGKELKCRAKLPEKDFWVRYCSEILSVLLEAFRNKDMLVNNVFASPRSENKNQQFQFGLFSLPSTGFTPENGPSSENKPRVVTPSERMILNSKILLVLARYKADFLKGFMELLVSRLCNAAAYAPVAVTIHSKQILTALAPLDSCRILKLVLPFASHVGNSLVDDVAVSSSNHVQLLALQVLVEIVKFVSAGQLLSLLQDISLTALPLLESSVVDIRKAVIFLLVEIYMVIGDALYPYALEMTPAQRKLLTIYIDRRIVSPSSVATINS